MCHLQKENKYGYKMMKHFNILAQRLWALEQKLSRRKRKEEINQWYSRLRHASETYNVCWL
jgi:hypothetical protein